MRDIKAIVYGVGAMGKTAAAQMLERGIQIVGAIGNRSNIGRDLGEVIGLEKALGVIITNDAASVLDQGADVAVVSVGSRMDDMLPIFKQCLSRGINVITIAEDPFYPWRMFPKESEELDAVAKKNGVTISAVGIQDVFWFSLASVLSGASHSIDSIVGTTMNNVDDFGPACAKNNCVGATIEEFNTVIASNAMTPSCFGYALEAIIADLGMELLEWKEWIEPVVRSEETYAKSLGIMVPAGRVIGRSKVTEIKTKQGPVFRAEMITKIFEEGETETGTWLIKGMPELFLEVKIPGPIATCSSMVNRIPDVIHSKPGLITVDKFQRVKYQAPENFKL